MSQPHHTSGDPALPWLLVAGSSERWTIGYHTGPGERLTGRLADERVYQTAKTADWWAETYARGAGLYAGQ